MCSEELVHFHQFKARLRQHAQERFRQHYARTLTIQEYAALCRLIRKHLPDRSSDRVKFLRHGDSSRISHWAVQHHGQWMPIIFNRRIGSILTILPPDKLGKSRYLKAAHGHGLPTYPLHPATYSLGDVLDAAFRNAAASA